MNQRKTEVTEWPHHQTTVTRLEKDGGRATKSQQKFGPSFEFNRNIVEINFFLKRIFTALNINKYNNIEINL
jgi:hypothetical protein